MSTSHGACARLVLAAGLLVVAPAFGEPLTADRAVQLALEKSPDVLNAGASVLDARSSLYSSYSGVLPQFNASVTRFGALTKRQTGSRVFGGVPFSLGTLNEEDYSTTPSIGGSWSVLNLSSLEGLSSARNGLKAAKLSQTATRNDVALAVRRQFYSVVGAIHLARVNGEALRLARDDERRVRALFEVGSVSKSDVLKAQVRTAQSELDSLTAFNQITTQRISLGTVMGVAERELGDIDTTLAVTPATFDEGAVLAEAEKHRPDLLSAEAELKAARAGRWSARLSRLPYVTVSGSGDFNPKNTAKTTELNPPPPDTTRVSRSESDRAYRAQIALNWDFFDGFATDSRNAAAQARLVRAQQTRDALRRNLAAEVQQSLLSYNEALQSWEVAHRAVDSADENMKLTQQKYNVGSATILDLIDAQVQLQRAQNQEVTARANIRVAEAGIRRVSGRSE